jgi:hypothetical protein
MDESKSYRRAFAIGLLTLGVALGGQMATSKLEAGEVPHCAFQPARAYVLYAPASPRTEAGLAQRVALAVIGAVLNGFV